MKQCPVCKTTYTDDTLRFCLADGTALETIGTSEPTIVIAGNAPPPTTPQIGRGSAASSSGKWIKLTAGIVIVGFIVLVMVAVAGVLVYYSSAGSRQEIAEASPSPAPTAAPPVSTDDDLKSLEREIANLQREIAKQANTAANTNPFPDAPDEERGSPVTATVDSPNDGFLALRAIPDAEYGTRLAKIPHGAEVEIQNCEKEQTRVSGRTGRWCMVIYNDQIGWVFDAWLEY